MEALNSTEEYDFWKFKGCHDFIDEWFLMSNPIPILIILSSYLLFVLKLGPDYMRKRQPMQLNNLIFIYNFAQVLGSIFLFWKGFELLRPVGLMQSICDFNEETILPLSTSIYYYFAAKLTELLDTVFFTLRKKDKQITFLHVYHHSITFMATWWALKYEPSYLYVFVGTLNSFIHIIMYSYYALSTFPGLSKYLWWKKYITSLQLIQFVTILIQVTANYYFSRCTPSKFLFNFLLINFLLFIYLFSDFYIKSYATAPIAKVEREEKTKDLLQNGIAINKKHNIFTKGIQTNTHLHEKNH